MYKSYLARVGFQGSNSGVKTLEQVLSDINEVGQVIVSITNHGQVTSPNGVFHGVTVLTQPQADYRLA